MFPLFLYNFAFVNEYKTYDVYTKIINEYTDNNR